MDISDNLISEFRSIVGARYVLTGERQTRRYRKGYRYGEGNVRAVVRPGTLVEQWKVLEACVAANAIVIMQAANTGLTGGSTPYGDDYDRAIVIVNSMRIRRIDLLSGGEQVLVLPGSTLNQLEKRLRPVGREPHSVIGSTCIGASVTGGICNNSGGSLIQRGPAYTQYALYAQIDADGILQLVNHLDISLGDDPIEILTRLDSGNYSEFDVDYTSNKWGSDREYSSHVRDVDAPTPARFNADPRRLFEASGSAGKLGVFALRIDTFPADNASKVFYIGTNSKAELSAIRREILSTFTNIPIAGEYMQREGFHLTERYGKDIFLMIKYLGTEVMPGAFAVKSWVDGICEKLHLGGAVTDKVVQFAMDRLPDHLPKRIRAYQHRFEHHLILKMGGDGIAEARGYLKNMFPSGSGDFFECSEEEGKDAFLHRFAFGGANGRFRATHQKQIEQVLALDVALPRNEEDWLPDLPEEIDRHIAHKNVCGHFFCHVLHLDYMIRKGSDPVKLKAHLLELLDKRGAEYPAEHNVGHIYEAKPALKGFYSALDPTNGFNPGIGKTSKRKNWA